MNIFINAITWILSLFLMLYLNRLLTSIYILILPLTSLIYIIIGKKIKQKEGEFKISQDSFFLFLNETLYGWKILKLFNSEKKRIDFFKQIIDLIRLIQIKKFKLEICSNILINVLSFFANSLIIIFGAYLIFKGKISLGMFTAFNNYSDTFKNSTLSFSKLNSIIQETSVSLSRISEILKYNDNNYENKRKKIYKTLDTKIKKIEIKNLFYKTSDNDEILKNVNNKFQVGNIYLIKGESGSGKTTILNILSKFIENYKGEILFNDVNIKNLDVKFLREKIVYITQENYLFSISIIDNIRLYRNLPNKDIISICKRLNIHNKIMSLPNKYETIINNNGTELSGGEKQRICIARSVADNPDVYLLDEITSNIDKNNTCEIIKIIEDISNSSIVIMTSHENLKFKKSIIKYNLIDKSFSRSV